MSARCFIVMGVSGCGKSSLAQSLAARSGGTFLDADDFHPSSNKEKMSAGQPLTDEDREPWLKVLNGELKRHHDSAEQPLFMACSALKQDYRDLLKQDLEGLQFLFLNGSFDLIYQRMQERQGHFMPPELVQSQFDTLEEPEEAIWYDVIDDVQTITDKFFRQFPELKSK